MRKTLIILTVAIAIGLVHAKVSQAQQHDHQDWNLMSIGRMATFARTDNCVQDKSSHFTCGVNSSHEAMAKMEEALNTFGCISYAEENIPKISQAIPFSRHDYGPVIVADVENMRCKTLPSTQLIPVDRDEFKERCSRLKWKCDLVWVPDGDPSVWYIGVVANIPKQQ